MQIDLNGDSFDAYSTRGSYRGLTTRQRVDFQSTISEATPTYPASLREQLCYRPNFTL